MKYKADGVPLVVFAGKEYGTGSSRDWAAKGTNLLGVKAVIAESFERIHRSNLVGMGVLPLQFKDGENAQTLGLDGSETFDMTGLHDGARQDRHRDRAHARDGSEKRFEVQGAAADAEGSRVLPPRRHPALRAAPAGGEEGGVTAGRRGACPRAAAIAPAFPRSEIEAAFASAVSTSRIPPRGCVVDCSFGFQRPARWSAATRPSSIAPAGLDVVDAAPHRAASRPRHRSARR